MDVIARTTYGLQIDSQKDPNNEFVKHSDALMNFSFRRPAFWVMSNDKFIASASKKCR